MPTVGSSSSSSVGRAPSRTTGSRAVAARLTAPPAGPHRPRGARAPPARRCVRPRGPGSARRRGRRSRGSRAATGPRRARRPASCSPRRRRSRSPSRPRTSTSPSSGASSPATTRMNVVLPAPFGPTSPRISPVRTSRSKPSSAWTSPKLRASPLDRIARSVAITSCSPGGPVDRAAPAARPSGPERGGGPSAPGFTPRSGAPRAPTGGRAPRPRCAVAAPCRSNAGCRSSQSWPVERLGSSAAASHTIVSAPSPRSRSSGPISFEKVGRLSWILARRPSPGADPGVHGDAVVAQALRPLLGEHDLARRLRFRVRRDPEPL